MDWYGFIIRFLHIGSGIFWIGGAMFWSLVVMPNVVSKVAPAARGPFIVTVGPVVAKALTNAGYATILFGIWNVFIISHSDFSLMFDNLAHTTWGVAIGIAFVLTLAAVGIADAVIKPTLRKMIEMIKAAPAPTPGAPPSPPPAFTALGDRMKGASIATVILAVLVIGLMVFAVKSRVG